MLVLLKISRWIDRLNDGIGKIVYWMSLLMVLIGAYNAIVRYLGKSIGANLSSNAYIEMQWYLFSLIFLLGAGYTLTHNAHVRVDVFYARLSEKGKAWVNLLGTVLFLLPFCTIMIIVSWESVLNSWHVMEVSPDPGGLARYPIKTMVLVAYVLLILQGLSELVKNVAVILGDPSVHFEETGLEGV